MICVELAFSDPDGAPRLALRAAHRTRLAELHRRGALLAAGPYAGDTGALLVFSCGLEEVETELAADPYYAAPGVEVLSIREWQPAVGP